MRGFLAAEVAQLPVRLHGIQLGRPDDLILDRDTRRVVGFDVLCRDDVHRFLPLAAAQLGDEAITIGSPLVLLEEDELAFYRDRGARLSGLRGAAVKAGGAAAGTLEDVVFASDGRVIEVVVAGRDGLERLDVAEAAVLATVAGRPREAA